MPGHTSRILIALMSRVGAVRSLGASLTDISQISLAMEISNTGFFRIALLALIPRVKSTQIPSKAIVPFILQDSTSKPPMELQPAFQH